MAGGVNVELFVLDYELWVLDYEGPTWREQGEEWTSFAGSPRARPASPAEVLAAAATLDGAEPDYEAAQKIIDNGWRGAVPIVDAALAGRKIVPLADKENTE